MSNSNSDSDSDNELRTLENEFFKKIRDFEENGPYTKDFFISLCKESYKDKLSVYLCDSLAASIDKFTVDELEKLKTLTAREQKYYDSMTCRSIVSIVESCAYDMSREQIDVFEKLINTNEMVLSLVNSLKLDYSKFFLIRDLLIPS